MLKLTNLAFAKTDESSGRRCFWAPPANANGASGRLYAQQLADECAPEDAPIFSATVRDLAAHAASNGMSEVEIGFLTACGEMLFKGKASQA